MNIRDIKSGFYTKKKKKFIHKVNFMNKKFLFYEQKDVLILFLMMTK